MEQEQKDLFERASSSSVLSFQSSTGSRSSSTPSHEEEEEEEEEGDGMRVEDVESVEEESRGGQQRGEAVPGVSRRLVYSGGHQGKSSGKGQTRVPIRSPHSRESASTTSDDSGSSQQCETEPPDVRRSHTLDANENANKNLRLQPPVQTSPPLVTEPPEGRVPTPLLHDSPTGGALRHHLDRTTPSNGGLLSSPIKLPYPPTSPKFRRDMRSSAPIFPSHVPNGTKVEGTEEGDRQMGRATLKPQMVLTGSGQQRQRHRGMSATVPPKAAPKIPMSQNASKTGAFQRPHSDGGRTRMLHQALEDTTHTKLCDTCGAKVHPSTIVNPPLHHTTHARREGQKDLRMHTMPAPKASHTVPRLKFAHTSHPVRQSDQYYSQPRHSRSPLLHAPTHTTHAPSGFKRPATMGRLDRDLDELSLSNLSLSSCSVASDILKRAQNRRDNFWTQPQVTAR